MIDKNEPQHERFAAPRATEESAEGRLIIQGVAVIDRNSDLVSKGVDTIEQTPHTFTTGTDTIEQTSHTFTIGADTIERKEVTAELAGVFKQEKTEDALLN